MSKCKTYKCKAACCYNIAMPIGMIQKYADKVVNKVLRTEVIPINPQFPLSEYVYTSENIHDNKCPFLRTDYKCHIYEERPKICRVFGDGTDPLLTCPYLKK